MKHLDTERGEIRDFRNAEVKRAAEARFAHDYWANIAYNGLVGGHPKGGGIRWTPPETP